MSSTSLINLPREIIYLIFEYLNKEHIAYAFFGLNNHFSLTVKYFIGKKFDLTKINNEIIFQLLFINYFTINWYLIFVIYQLVIHIPYQLILNIY